MRGFLYLFTVLSLIGLSLWGGYEYGWYKASWQRRLLNVGQYNNNLSEGFFQEGNTLVVFGKLVNLDLRKKFMSVSVFNNLYKIKINDKTTLIGGSQPYETAKNGNRVTIDMEYDKPFVADKIYFSK